MMPLKIPPIKIITLLLVVFQGVNAQKKKVYPLSDSTNTQKWTLLKEVSDEFNKNKLDLKKWWAVGEFKNGKPEYKNPQQPAKKVWIGRAPSQFSGNNYRFRDGKLLLDTKWEPDFPFSQKPDKAGKKFENITTACIIAKNQFRYGYMEIRCKAADAPITSSFWATGKGTELDVFEFFGDHQQPQKEAAGKDKEFLWTIIDWTKRPKHGRRNWREDVILDWRVADDFHTYGCDWGPTYLKYYADGKLIGEITKEEVEAAGKDWILVQPMKIWLDQETFPWNGIPAEKDLPAEFEIDYVRVWQKK